jgi:hypothetical protein
MFGLGFLKTVFGWWALILIAVAIAVAQFIGGLTWVRRILWVLAAIFAAAGAINEWGSQK